MGYSRFQAADDEDFLSVSGSVRDRGFIMVKEYGKAPLSRPLRQQPALTASVFSSPSMFSSKHPNTVSAIPSETSFADQNANFRRDADEPSVQDGFGVLVTKEFGVGKLVLAGDCGWMQDFLIRSTGNRLLWAGVQSWLLNPKVSDVESDTKDHFLLRTSKQSKSFLWLTTVLVPLSVLWLGFMNLVWLRKKK